jgi:transposase
LLLNWRREREEKDLLWESKDLKRKGRSMDREEQDGTGKSQLVMLMQTGSHWKEAAQLSGVQISRSAAYRLMQKVRMQGEAGLQDGRQGHPSKLREPVLQWLKAYCQASPNSPSHVVAQALEKQFGIRVSISHLNATRARLGLTTQSRQDRKKNRRGKVAVLSSSNHGYLSRSVRRSYCPDGKKQDREPAGEVQWQEGAGGLLLVAVAQETGLLTQLETALTSCSDDLSVRLARLTAASRHMLVLTLLFLGAVGLRRTWDLRRYAGDALALLTGRWRAYGYHHVERFLRQIAHTGAAQALTNALGKWTAHLWEPPAKESVPRFYIDEHRKPVYTDRLIPRGRIGRTGKILGCRALTLLHDEWGHPRLVMTDRGDLHLTKGLPQMLACSDQIKEMPSQARIILDREGMAASFLKALCDAGQIVVTMLRTNQYHGLESFTEVGPFMPLSRAADGTVQREVAPACFALVLPEQKGAVLPLRVALIGDMGRSSQAGGSILGDADLASYQDDWQAHPSSSGPSQPPLIAIVTTQRDPIDAVELAQTYIHRWLAQENVIKDFLLPLGLDTNHGFAKTPVVNSEAAKKRDTLQKQLNTARTRMISARTRYHGAMASKAKLLERIKENEHQYHLLNTSHQTLDPSCIDHEKLERRIKKEKEKVSLQQAKMQKRVQQLSHDIYQEKEKCQCYAQKQCTLLRSLEDLTTNERTMYELDAPFRSRHDCFQGCSGEFSHVDT